MCQKHDQTPDNTPMSPTINEESKNSFKVVEPKCKQCFLRKQSNPGPEMDGFLKVLSGQKNKFVRSFFGRSYGSTILIQDLLTFKSWVGR